MMPEKFKEQPEKSSAFPYQHRYSSFTEEELGLTKLEYVATQIAGHLLAHRRMQGELSIIEDSVRFARMLIGACK